MPKMPYVLHQFSALLYLTYSYIKKIKEDKDMEISKKLRGVLSRDGQIKDFDLFRIINAERKAFDASGVTYNDAILETLALKAVERACEQAVDEGDTEYLYNGHLKVETIQDGVIKALYSCDFNKVADRYKKYRSEHQKAREMMDAIVAKRVNNYARESDDFDPLASNNNASQPLSISGLHQYLSGEDEKTFWDVIYDKEDKRIRATDQEHKRWHYTHDKSMISGYCAGWSLKKLITTGIISVGGNTAAGPAKHLDVLCVQMVNFLGIMQAEWAGAQAFSSFDTYLAPFLKSDCAEDFEYTYKLANGDVEGAQKRMLKIAKNAIEKFVYGVNVPCRWGSLPPFSNVTFDWAEAPKDLKNEPAIVGGKQLVIDGNVVTYGDCKPEMDVINKAFLLIMTKGDPEGRGFQYPIPSYSITKDFDWSDTENNRLLFEMTAKYGTPNFMNYVNSDMDPTDVRSMCCRLRLDLRELRRKAGGNFGAGEETGSIGVETLNLPLLAYESTDRKNFYELLDEDIDICISALNIKRKTVQHFMNKGLYPYSRFYLASNGAGHELKNHFSTIGVVGMNEMCLNTRWNYFGDLTNEAARSFCEEVLDHIREKLADYQQEFPEVLYNLEATPAESTSHKLARDDRKENPDIVTAGTVDAPYYTNSSALPVNAVDDIFDALDMEDPLQVKYTSGTIFHTFLGERLQDWETAAKLVKAIAGNYKLPTFTLSPTYSICPDDGYIAGEHFTCPHCGKPAQVFSRITGYYRPVENFNNGKRQEFTERALFDRSASDEKEVNALHGFKKIMVLGTAAEEAEKAPEANTEVKAERPILLVKAQGCPKCKEAEALVEAKDALGKLKIVQFETDEGFKIAEENQIMAAPAIINGSDIIRTLDKVKEFIEAL